MKFALATGLLTGSLPVVSVKAVDTTLQGAQNVLLRNTNGAIQEGNSLQSIQDCDPSSDDPDVGVLSCGQGRVCLPKDDSLFGGNCASKDDLLNLLAEFRKRGGGTLRNSRSFLRESSWGSLECDPTEDPDVGILSCASSETCVPSTSSSLGGFCASSIEGRRLQDLTDPTGICDPASPNYLLFDCDCSGLNNSTGSGLVTCTGYQNYCLGADGGIYASCTEICVTSNFTYTYFNFTTPIYTFCIEASSPYSQSVCLNQSLVDNTCTIEFNGDPCTSCAVVPPANNYYGISFDCTNVGADAMVGYYFADMLPIVQDTCFPDTTTGTNYSCDICNGPLVNPDAIATVIDYAIAKEVNFSFSCSNFSTLLNSSTCERATPFLVSTCCNASGSDANGDNTTGSGDNASGSDDNNIPSSGRSTRSFATTIWLATLGLALAWTFGHTH